MHQLPGRNLYRINQTPEWITIPSISYPRNVWKKSGSLQNFLDAKIGINQWQVRYYFKKKYYNINQFVEKILPNIIQDMLEKKV